MTAWVIERSSRSRSIAYRRERSHPKGAEPELRQVGAAQPSLKSLCPPLSILVKRSGRLKKPFLFLCHRQKRMRRQELDNESFQRGRRDRSESPPPDGGVRCGRALPAARSVPFDGLLQSFLKAGFSPETEFLHGPRCIKHSSGLAVRFRAVPEHLTLEACQSHEKLD